MSSYKRTGGRPLGYLRQSNEFPNGRMPLPPVSVRKSSDGFNEGMIVSSMAVPPQKLNTPPVKPKVLGSGQSSHIKPQSTSHKSNNYRHPFMAGVCRNWPTES